MEIINPYGFIYITTNMINGKRYIGQKMFCKGWEAYLGSGKHFKKAIKKYGRENFIKEIIAIAYSKEELNKLEIEFIKLHNAVESDDYYNLCDGGNGISGFTMSVETKRKQSEAHKGEKSYIYGKQLSEKIKNKMSKAKLGKQLSEETKQKMSDAKRSRSKSIPKYNGQRSKKSEAKIGKNNPMYGKHFSEETKKKQSEMKIKLNHNQITEIIEKHKTGKYTQTQLCFEYSVSNSTIHRIINYEHLYK